MNHERRRTRREFLMDLARGAAYTAPAVTTFAVAPALLQGQSSQHKHNASSGAQARPEGSPPAERPSEKYRPPRSPRERP